MSILYVPGYVDLPGVDGNYLSVPDSAPLDIVGDICIVWDLSLDDWTPSATQWLTSKRNGSVTNSYRARITSGGIVESLHSPDGTDAAQITASSTAAVGVANGTRTKIAVTLDVNDGAGNRQTRFWTSTNGLVWTQLGTTVTVAGTTSIFSSTSTLLISANTGGVGTIAGNLHSVSIRSGIGASGTVGGTEVFRFDGVTDLTDVDPAAASFVAYSGQTVTVNRSGTPSTVIVPTVGPEYVIDTPTTPTTWSVDLCQGWQRIGQLQANAFEFQGVQRRLDFGEWVCTFPEGEPSWSSYNDPDLPNYLSLDGTVNTTVSTTDKAALDVTGNIDVRWFGTLTNWDGTTQTLKSKWDAFTNNRSWLLWATASGIQVVISTDGTAGTEAGSAGFAVPYPDGTYCGVRFTRTQSTGVTTVYFSDDGVTWASAGTSVLAAGTAIFSSNAEVVVGGHSGGFGSPATGRCLWTEYRNGIAGTVVASPDFSSLVANHHLWFSPLVDAQGNIWQGAGNARVFADPLVEVKVYGPEDVDTVRLVADNTITYAGYVGEQSTGTGGTERTVTAGGVRWTLSGPDLWDVLRTRLAFPVPADVPPWSDDYNERTGVASTVLAGYLSDNAGVTARTERVIGGFSVVDTVAGATDDFSARGQPLDELAKRICADYELICRFSVTFAGDVIVRIETPRDLSERFLLSDQGDLTNIKSRLVPARATYVVAGGQGVGVSRAFLTADSGATGGDRRELFSDQASLVTLAELRGSVNATLRLNAETWSVSAETTDAAADSLPFGTEILIGDSINIEINGRRHVVPVAAITWSITAERRVVRPTLGTAVPDALKGLIRDVGDLQSRFATSIA